MDIAVSVKLNEVCTEYWTFNTFGLIQDGRLFSIFKCMFLNEKGWISIKISLKFVAKSSINNKWALVQIIIWTNGGLVYWYIYASLGLNELITLSQTMMNDISDTIRYFYRTISLLISPWLEQNGQAKMTKKLQKIIVSLVDENMFNCWDIFNFLYLFNNFSCRRVEFASKSALKGKDKR